MKMKASIITAGIVAGLLFASSGVMAAPHGKNLNIKGVVNVTQIGAKIKSGVRSGRLTAKESRVAKAGLNSLKAKIKAVKKDRKITHQEKRQIRIKNTRLKRVINKLLNNKTVVKNKRKSKKLARY